MKTSWMLFIVFFTLMIGSHLSALPVERGYKEATEEISHEEQKETSRIPRVFQEEEGALSRSRVVREGETTLAESEIADNDRNLSDSLVHHLEEQKEEALQAALFWNDQGALQRLFSISKQQELREEAVEAANEWTQLGASLLACDQGEERSELKEKQQEVAVACYGAATAASKISESEDRLLLEEMPSKVASGEVALPKGSNRKIKSSKNNRNYSRSRWLKAAGLALLSFGNRAQAIPDQADWIPVANSLEAFKIDPSTSRAIATKEALDYWKKQSLEPTLIALKEKKDENSFAHEATKKAYEKLSETITHASRAAELASTSWPYHIATSLGAGMMAGFSSSLASALVYSREVEKSNGRAIDHRLGVSVGLMAGGLTHYLVSGLANDYVCYFSPGLLAILAEDNGHPMASASVAALGSGICTLYRILMTTTASKEEQAKVAAYEAAIAADQTMYTISEEEAQWAKGCAAEIARFAEAINKPPR